MNLDLHVIYTRSDRILVSRRRYESWRQIQDEIADYMASLGPWPPDEMIEYLDGEHPGLDPSAAEQVGTLVSSTEPIIELKFARGR
ncbi:hypothetical protein KDW61_21105 [Burkholderia cenocepacia]|uniref:hypothetical protein n=1 Tax=Burkholderia cenocepacia TaxID=95486 RepID=UPI001B94AC41|nr:hypothetical protein [Burkholderia cenocepacia]MBR8211164.1 hypothetical protein [Burkholderia cenocepacia]